MELDTYIHTCNEDNKKEQGRLVTNGTIRGEEQLSPKKEIGKNKSGGDNG